MQCILYKIYFWKVFHMNYNLICIFICTPICTNFFILVKSGCYKEDADDGGDATTPPAVMPPPPAPPAVTPEEINDEGPVEMIPEQEAPVPHEVILADAEPEMPQLCLYHALMRDYEENPLMIENDFDDLDDESNEGCSDMDEWFLEDGSNDRD
jgi:hypothetical protein